MGTTLLESEEKLQAEHGGMKFALIHLSGSRRGLTQEFHVDRLAIGTDPTNDLAFDPVRDSVVSAWHAELVVENCELILRDRGSQSGTFVNHQCIVEIILQDNDLLQFGQGGPQLRIRIRPEAYAHCKPLKDILCDCRDIARTARRGWVVSTALFFRHLLSDLTFHATTPVKLLAGALVLVPVALLTILLYVQYAARSASERQVRELLNQIETGRVSQGLLEKQVREARNQVTEFLDEHRKQAESIAILVQRKEQEKGTQTEVAHLRQHLHRVEAELAAAERIIRAFRGGVVFIQGAFGFTEKGAGRPLRYRGLDANGDPLRDADGQPLFTFEGDAPPVTVSFTGTGFLVDARGVLLTNRHLAQPWEMDRAALQLIETGLEPRLLELRAFFPEVPIPFDLSVMRVSQQADVALVGFDPGSRKLPVLPLAAGQRKIMVGESILLLGYPTGFDALLARADSATFSEIRDRARDNPNYLAQELADRGLIRPLTTQGHVGDIQADRLIYDAQTTFGGSGGPVFNLRGEVIAINSMIMPRFAGANFGVPIRFGIELLTENQQTS